MAAHYTRGDLLTQLLEALRRAGADIEALRPEDLEAVEEFHVGGRPATERIAGLLGLSGDGGERVLDVGSGIGGAARYLARRFGCRVDGVDLTEEYCHTARELSRLAGAAESTHFHHGSVLDLPFGPRSFDAAIQLHVGMNIEDKARLASEVARVLRPGGRYVIYDLFARQPGSSDRITFPVPWAASRATSFLVTAEAQSEVLEQAGFTVSHREDLGEWGTERLRAALQAPPGQAPKVGLPALIGAAARERLGNVLQALEQGLVAPWAIAGRISA
ncbi:MAG: class I SAM-dependent methyltransferase [Acidobacteria bacterium]|nr:MAG: class I SAM-dependent methyltransferase [Acidobacteriota bacterium]REK09138.1 MAG: class I SAM-dependent methyltransferase [Acidobacteriota bacterium]